MRQSKPVIAVIACVREVEGEAASIVKRRYLDAVARFCDAVPVIAPAMGCAADAAALVARVDAVLLTIRGVRSSVADGESGLSVGCGHGL